MDGFGYVCLARLPCLASSFFGRRDDNNKKKTPKRKPHTHRAHIDAIRLWFRFIRGKTSQKAV